MYVVCFLRKKSCWLLILSQYLCLLKKRLLWWLHLSFPISIAPNISLPIFIYDNKFYVSQFSAFLMKSIFYVKLMASLLLMLLIMQ